MTPIENVKQELLREIEKLPEPRLKEVLQFVNFLVYSQNQLSYQYQINLAEPKKSETLMGDSDPLAEFIGAVSHGFLAEDVDAELYDK